MELTINKTNQGRIAESNREVQELDVYAGSISAPSRRGRTMRLILQDSRFAPADLRSALTAGLETGKYYHIKAVVDVKDRSDQTKSVEVREVLEAIEIEAFPFEAKHITYVRPTSLD